MHLYFLQLTHEAEIKVKKARDVVEKILLEKKGKTYFIKNFLAGNSIDDSDYGDDISNNCNNDGDDDDNEDDDDHNGRDDNNIIALIRLDFKIQN
jgi:hypothetical protein